MTFPDANTHDEEKRQRLAQWRQQEQAERDATRDALHAEHDQRYGEQIAQARRHARARERLTQLPLEPAAPPSVAPTRRTRPSVPKPPPPPAPGFSLRDGEDRLFSFAYGLLVISALVFVVVIGMALSRESSAGTHTPATTQSRSQTQDAEIGGDDPCLDTICRGD